MKKRFGKGISLLLSAAMLMTVIPVSAETSVTVAGEVLYAQDFEGKVEELFNKAIGGPDCYKVIERDGNHMLAVDGYAAYGHIGWFGPTVADSIIKADVMQIGADGTKGAYFAFGLRGKGVSNAKRNLAGFADVMLYDFDNGKYDAAATQVRDRLMLGITSATNDYSNTTAFDIDTLTTTPTGVLQMEQYATDTAKAYERNFGGSFYRMTGSAIGTKMTAQLSTLSGSLIQRAQTETTGFSVAQNAEGQANICSRSIMACFDNIKVYAPLTVTSFTAEPQTATGGLGAEVPFTLTSDSGQTIAADAARFEYDPEAVKIDFAHNTITALKAGTHTITVFLDDLYSDASLRTSFTFTGVAPLKLEFADHNLNIGETASFKLYNGSSEITQGFTASAASGLSVSGNQVTAAASGVHSLTVSYDGQEITIPVAVNNPDEKLAVKGAEPIYQRTFDEATITEEFITGATNSENVNVIEDGGNKVLAITGKTYQTTAQFGPKDMKNYSLEYDFKQTAASGSSICMLGAGMRTTADNKGYRFTYLPVIKYEPATHTVSGTASSFARVLSIARSEGTNKANEFYYGGISEPVFPGHPTNAYYHLSNTIIGDSLSIVASSQDGSTTYGEFTTTTGEIDKKKDGTAVDTILQGGTMFVSHGGDFNIDNVKLYEIDALKDISVEYGAVVPGEAVPFTVYGIREDDTKMALASSSVTVATSGAVTATNENFTISSGTAYVTVTYTDSTGAAKSKVVKLSAEADSEFIIKSFSFVNPDGSDSALLVSGGGAFVNASILRTALGGSAPQLVLATYDVNTNIMQSVTMERVEAVQAVGDMIYLSAKLKLPADVSNLLAKAFLWDGNNLVPLAKKIEQ